MNHFSLHQPDSLEAASSLLTEHGEGAKILAGGTELILLLKLGVAHCQHLIDVKGISNLDRLQFDSTAQVLRIGSLVTHRVLERSKEVQEHFPLLADMERQVANVRIRNIGTLAGNLCFAEPHADPGALLVAYQARIKARSPERERTLKVSDFFVDYYETAIEKNEILSEIEIPKLGPNFSGTYLRFCPGERPMVGVALIIGWNGEGAEDVRIVLGCVGPKPLRASELEESLTGKPADEVLARSAEAGEKAALLCDPTEDIWGTVEYKRQIVKTLVTRGLSQLCHRKAASRGTPA